MKMDQSNMRTFGALFAGSLVKKLGFLSLLFFSVNSAALDDGTWIYYLDGDNVRVDGCSGKCPSELVIPNTLLGKSVTGIGVSAFMSNELTHVIIPDGVTSIGVSAFASNQLTSVTIPDGATSIGATAFYGNQLTSVTIPGRVTSIGVRAFYGNQLASVTIGDSVTSIGDSAFSYNQLTSVTIGDSVTSIGERAFYSNLLTSVTISDSVTSIGWQAFHGSQLTSVTIPGSVASIGGQAFYGNQLTSVTIPDSVTSIGDGAFHSNQLTSVTIGGGVTSIGESAFSNNQLTSLAIPDSVTSIGPNVFKDNPLKSLTLGKGLVEIPIGAFRGFELTSLTIPSSVTSIGGGAFYGNQLTSVTIPSSVTHIGASAFYGNQLTSVTIPDSVTHIGTSAFTDNRISTVYFQGDRPNLERTDTTFYQSTNTDEYAAAPSVIYYCRGLHWPGADIDSITPVISAECDAGAIDTDADGIGNNADTDDDNDGATDFYDAAPFDQAVNMDKNGSEIVMLGNHYYQASNPSVEALSDGGFVSIWGSCNTYCQVKDIYGRRFGQDGIALGEMFLVNTETYDSQLDPALSELADGGFVVAWTGFQSGPGQIYGQRFGSNGEKIGDEFLVTDDSQNTTRYIDVVGLNNGGFAVIWPSQDRSGLYAQMFDANGLAVGDESLISATHQNHYQISASSLGSGFVVARVNSFDTNQTNGISIHLVGANGTASSEPTLLETVSLPYEDISISSLSNDGFVVSWSDIHNNGRNVFAQIFSPAGDAVGDRFVVNTFLNNSINTMKNPSIASLPDGGFFITWQGGHPWDGSDTGLIGQRFASDGAFIGGEVLVNTFTDGYQSQPAVSGGSNGNFVVTWLSSGVVAQRFSLKLDSDDDGVADTYDLFPLDPNETLDTDNDGIGDNTDTDGDNDGVEDSLDAFPFDPTETTDTDLDGIGNNADNDDDNDGIFDSLDTSPLDGANGFLFSIDGDNVTITGCFSACPAELVIPNTLLGKSVTGIGREAFYNSGILSVQIPEGIAEIGDGAFARNQLTSVIIPGSVKILEATFYDNYQLTSVTIGDGVNVIGRSVFNSTNLTSINIPNSVTTIGESAFLNNQLTSVTIPESVTVIGDRAFDRNKLTSITIPDSVTIIGRDAFQNNQLTNVIIPGSVTSLGRGAFSRNQLTNVTILEGVTVIKSGTFALNQLASVTIPESVASLSSTAFNDNIGVNNGTWKYFLISNDAMILGCVETCPPDLVIPESIDGYSVKIIGARAFRGNQLTSLSIPSSVTTVNAWAFGQNQFTQVSFLGARPVLNNNAFVQSLAISNISYCEDQAGWPGAEIESVTPVSSGQCDLDSDGVNDDNDAFPDDPTESIDTDGDGIGNNSDTDDDNDGVADVDDAYPLDPTASSDTDNDGVADNFDAFPLDASETLDHDGDGIGNNADTDDDNDGLSDTAEITIGTNPLLVDTDGDDFIDGSDAFPLDFFEWLDTDNDGIGNNTDLDDDSDGIEDALDRFSLIPYDPTQKLLDIDGNGRVGALTDALIILRYMFGFNGDALIDDAVAEDATRTSSEEIEAYLGSLMPNL